MANEEHLKILEQGVEVWNWWRITEREIQPDLSGAHLDAMDLGGVDLHNTDLSGTKLNKANLSKATLRGANLRRSRLNGADLYEANLSKAILREADLLEARIDRANLNGADFFEVALGRTSFGDVDLSEVSGLDKIYHNGPSYIDIQTLLRSKYAIPEIFLRGIGVPDTFITYFASLSGEAIQYYSCFISYSTKDEAFAQPLYADLQDNGVRCWFAPEDMKIGDEIRPRIDQSIRLHDKLLVVLSEHSIGSDWVEDEVETAIEEERKRKRTVLFPIRLDEAVMETREAWAAKIRRTRHIGDFSHWNDHDSYQEAFERLLRDLKAEEG
jgi:uncharacterized protein YjbI with pentapeptide repeats